MTVSALPLDRVVSSSNGEDPNQLNLFLHRVTLIWVGETPVCRPSTTMAGKSPTPRWRWISTTCSPPTGARDFHAEILLGYAMQLMHETPVLSRAAIREGTRRPSPIGGASAAARQAL